MDNEYCSCGFAPMNGHELSQHLYHCQQSSFYHQEPHQQREAGQPQDDALNLVLLAAHDHLTNEHIYHSPEARRKLGVAIKKVSKALRAEAQPEQEKP